MTRARGRKRGSDEERIGPRLPRLSRRQRAAIVELERGGRITPAAVVDAARPPTSVLHPCFEWDDKKASEAYRLSQARRLIRGVPALVTAPVTRLINAVRYVRDPSVPEHVQGYVTSEQLRTEPENARTAIADAFERAATWLRRAEDLAEVLGFRKDVESVSHRVDKLRRRVEQPATV